MHGYVVFDNNTYKYITPARLNRIIAAERDHGIIPLANVVVLQELLARVRDPDPRVRGRNRSAIKKLGQHCKTTNDRKISISFLSPVDSQVYYLLVGKHHPSDAAMFETFSNMIRVVTLTDVDDPLSEISNNLDQIEKFVENIEEEYMAALNSAATSKGQPNRMKRNFDYAARIAQRVQTSYKHRFSPEEIVLRIIAMAKITTIGFALQDLIVSEIRSKGGGHTQHANSVWDEEVVSSTSMYTTIRGTSVLLVTEEKRLIAAAATVAANDHVIDTASYEQFLGLPAWTPPQT